MIDYRSERGGKLGIVLQFERGEGDTVRTLLTAKNVAVMEPSEPQEQP